jgi:HSP20 family molecular chaperone IbpA
MNTPTNTNTPATTGAACCGGTSCDTTHAKSARSVTYRPPLDLYHFPDRYEITIDLPGAAADQINATIDDSTLTVQARVPSRYPQDATPLHAEFGVGDFERQLRIGEDVDPDRLSARYENGVLTLVLPKRAERKPRRIPITPV